MAAKAQTGERVLNVATQPAVVRYEANRRAQWLQQLFNDFANRSDDHSRQLLQQIVTRYFMQDHEALLT